MYWTTLSLFMTAENLAYPIISWLPFYSWIRFGFHLYLVLPGQQGSVFIYQNHIHPFLEQHEREIDHFISESHDRAKKSGLSAIQQGIEYIKVNVLGLQPARATPPPNQNATYAQNLLGRFSMPSARPGLGAAGATDIFSMLGSAVQQATYPTSRSRDAQVEDLSASGSLVPPHITGAERSQFITTQRDRLRILLQAYDKEAYEAEPGSPIHGAPHGNSRQPADALPKSRSESDFEDLAYTEVPENKRKSEAIDKASSWGKWVWSNYGEKNSALPGKKEQ